MTTTYELEPFQENGINLLGKALVNHMSVLGVSPGGSGKTVILSAIAHRFINKTDQNVLILVHREELLHQTREKLLEWYGFVSQQLDDKTKYLTDNRITVAMVETFNSRTKMAGFLNHFKNVGLLIVDECHIGNFKKIYQHFLLAKRIGFSATPIAATKKDPLKNYYQTIVIISKPSELIELNKVKPTRGIVPARAMNLSNVDRSQFRAKGQEFDEDQVGAEFAKGKQIENTLNAYITHGIGRKTVCFNANIDHSLKMNKAFIESGFPARHLDSKLYGDKSYRKDTFLWLKKTKNAILNNVGIATTGFDEPSIETIILNSSMMSLSLGIQKIVRGSRPYLYPDGRLKEDFLLLDMGNNIDASGGNFGDGSDDIDWEFMFWNPKEPKPGVPVIKTCPECGAMMAASARVCTAKVEDWVTDDNLECGYLFPMKSAEEDNVMREMVEFSKGVDVKKCIKFFENREDYYSMFQLVIQLANNFRNSIEGDYLDALQLEAIFEITINKMKEWFKEKKKRRFPNFEEDFRNKILNKLRDVGFIINVEELIELENK